MFSALVRSFIPKILDVDVPGSRSHRCAAIAFEFDGTLILALFSEDFLGGDLVAL